MTRQDRTGENSDFTDLYTKAIVTRIVALCVAGISLASPVAGQWTYSSVGEFLRTGVGRVPTNGHEAAAFAVQFSAHLGYASGEVLASYARCLASGAIGPDSPGKRYPVRVDEVKRRFERGVIPTSSFEAAVYVALLIPALGERSVQPIFRMYSERCWSLDQASGGRRPRRAGAHLNWIEAADVDAGRALSSAAWDRLNTMMNGEQSIRWEDFGRVREVCLPTGAYVLAVQRYTASAAVAGIVASDQVLALRFLVADSHPRDAWWPFTINERTCPRVIAIGGRVRIYELRTRNLW